MTYETHSGNAALVCDWESESYHVEFYPGANIVDHEELLDLLPQFDLEMLHEEESPAEFHDGVVTVWCALIDGEVSPERLADLMERSSRWQD